MNFAGENRQSKTGQVHPSKIVGSSQGKVVWTAILVPSFYVMDWALVGVTAALVSFLKFRGFSDLHLWLTLWALNLVYSGAVIILNERSSIDFTLMETSRRLTNSAAKKSKWAGRFIELAVFIRLLLWDGPDQLLIFFKERLPSRLLKGAFFVVTSGFQMFIWAQLYILGFESIGDLMQILR